MELADGAYIVRSAYQGRQQMIIMSVPRLYVGERLVATFCDGVNYPLFRESLCKVRHCYAFKNILVIPRLTLTYLSSSKYEVQQVCPISF